MNANRLIMMFAGRAMRLVMSKGIDAGIDRFSKDKNQTPAQNKQRAAASKDMARKAQQGAKVLRRLGRF